MNELEDIKNRIDIVDLIQSYIPLKKAGRDYKALCPFHNEKTPSFMISPEKQIWHCFGCSKGGDIFRFVMEMEGMEFGDALRLLAKKAGIQLHQAPREKSDLKNKLYEANNLAALFYHKILQESKHGDKARDYLKKRGVTQDSILDFKLGYALDSWDTTLRFLEKKRFSDNDAIAAGLAIKNEKGRTYDRFRGRIMFPITNTQGYIVGFSARALGDTKEAKYINTPQTAIYDKSNILYGLDQAKMSVRKEDKVILVEGNMDVISSFAAGVKNVVASSGTALTGNQIRILGRYSKNVILAFDTDSAGDEATKRGIYDAIEAGLNLYVADLGQFKDPDEAIKKDPKLWRKIISTACNYLDFFIKAAIERTDKNDVSSKKKAAAEILPVLKKVPDRIEQAHYIQKLASILDVPEKSINDAMMRIKEKKGYTEERKSKKISKTPNQLVSEKILGTIFVRPEWIKKAVTVLDVNNFDSVELGTLFKSLQAYYTNVTPKGGKFDLDDFYKKISAEHVVLAKELAFVCEEEDKESTEEDIAQELSSCIERLKKAKLKEGAMGITRDIKNAEKKGDKKETEKLMKKFQSILKEEKAI